MRHSVAYTPITDPSLCPIAAQETIASLPKNMLEGKVVYLDYPNNPSGAYDAETMRSVVDHVAESGAIPIVDFAFGEVMGEEYYAALRYTLERQGIALGSVSKTQGLPGLRSGYAILPEIIARNGYSGPQRLVFGLNHEAEFVYRRLFEMQPDGTTLAHTHAERVARYNREANLRLYEALRELGFSLGTTTYETPIQIVVSEIPDFYQRLRRIGIVTESLADYAATLGDVEGLGDRAVRMLTPRPCQLEITIERLKDCIM
jgi:histidinol-phosphate/aromatic aminotransferase/cobyric acid decarboxylase-like protein